MAVVSGLPLSREASLNSPPSTPTKRRDHPTQSLEIVKLCCGLRQEILDPETALALHRDDAGTFSNTGSIGGVTIAKPAAFLRALSMATLAFRERWSGSNASQMTTCVSTRIT
jgi:hypothetical protein